MFRPLRWYEKALLEWLARSPRIDLLQICQFPDQLSIEERKQLYKDLDRQAKADHLEAIWKKQV